MKLPAASCGVSSSLLGRHSVLGSVCPVLDTGESRNNKHFWTPATLSRRKPGAGVTALMTFCEALNVDEWAFGFCFGHWNLRFVLSMYSVSNPGGISILKISSGIGLLKTIFPFFNVRFLVPPICVTRTSLA